MTTFASLRPIEPRDDAAVAAVIRSVMPEFGADGPGTALHDPEVGEMSAHYAGPRARFFVCQLEARIVGCGGIAPLTGGDEDTAELRKMYLLPEARGLGLGRALLRAALLAARELGYARVYLETMEHMTAARSLYESVGFRQTDRMGETGHFACHCAYLLDLATSDPQ